MHIVLRAFENSLTFALDELKPHSPANRDSQEVFRIRNHMNHRIAELGLSGSIHGFRVIPPEELSGLTGYGYSGRNLLLTDIGKTVVILKEAWHDLHLLMGAGRARESLKGNKPKRFLRSNLPAKSVRLLAMHDSHKEPVWLKKLLNVESSQLPESDWDFIAFSKDGWPPLESIKRRISSKKLFHNHNGGWTEIKQSSRRSGFVRVEFGVIGGKVRDILGRKYDQRRISLGHIFYPNFKGEYSPGNPLLPFLMESPRVDIPLLLVPYKDKNGETTIWGIAVDFFGGFQDLAKHRMFEQTWFGELYAQALYHFPDLVFPEHEPQELLFKFGYMLRNLPWFGKMPAIAKDKRSPIIESELEPSNYHIGGDLNRKYKILRKLPEASGAPWFLKRDLPRQTAKYIRQKVVRRLHEIGIVAKERLGSISQRRELGISFIEDLAEAMNGDIIATMLRLMSGDIHQNIILENPGLFEIEVPGFSIASSSGIFTELGRVLEEAPHIKDLFTSLITNAARLRRFEKQIEEQNEYKAMVLSKYGTDRQSGRKIVDEDTIGLIEEEKSWLLRKIQSLINSDTRMKSLQDRRGGKKAFFDLLFQVAEGDRIRVLELLRPVWCNHDEWVNILGKKEFMERLITLDTRFEEKPNDERNKKRILWYLSRRKQPMTASELYLAYCEYHGDPYRWFASFLARMETERVIIGIGEPILHGQSRQIPSHLWFCLPEDVAKFKNSPEYSSLRARVLFELQHSALNFDDLAKKTGFPSYIIYEALNVLMKNGEIEKIQLSQTQEAIQPQYRLIKH